jgi:hypothetical protein
MDYCSKDSYFNVDIGSFVQLFRFYAHGTVKNAIENEDEIFTQNMK